MIFSKQSCFFGQKNAFIDKDFLSEASLCFRYTKTVTICITDCADSPSFALLGI